MTAPPQNLEAERLTLGAMLVSEPAVRRVIDQAGLRAEDFYLDRHQRIYAVMCDLHTAGKPIDHLTVADALGTAGELDQVGGKDALFDLSATVAAPGNAKYHGEIVKTLATQRATIELGYKLIETATAAPVDGEVSELAGQIVRLVAQENRAGSIVTVRGSDVRMRAPRFLDAARMILRGSLSVLTGGPGYGKTLYGMNLAAAVTTGRLEGLDGPGVALISSAEDDPEAVLAPRLAAAGADLDRAHFVQGLTLPSEVEALAAQARKLKADFLLIDPIGAHLDPSIDSHRDAATRAALSPLGTVAAELSLAVLAIAHTNKNTGSRGLDRISGSLAFGAAARSVIAFGPDPADPEGEAGSRRLIGHLKSNVSKRAPSLTAEIQVTEVETEDGTANVPRLTITGASDLAAEEVLTTTTPEERSEREEAAAFLVGLLADTPIRSKEIKTAAESAGLAWRTVERAKTDLKIKPKQEGDGWYWRLPEGRNDG